MKMLLTVLTLALFALACNNQGTCEDDLMSPSQIIFGCSVGSSGDEGVDVTSVGDPCDTDFDCPENAFCDDEFVCSDDLVDDCDPDDEGDDDEDTDNDRGRHHHKHRHHKHHNGQNGHIDE